MPNDYDEDIALAENDVIDDDDEEDVGGDPAWLVTFGDCISLLLTFFVLLLSFSTFEDPDPIKEIVSFKPTISTGKLVTGLQFKNIEITHKDTQAGKIMKEHQDKFNLDDQRITAQPYQENVSEDTLLTIEKLNEVVKENSQRKGTSPEDGIQSDISHFKFTLDPGIYFHKGRSHLKEESKLALHEIFKVVNELPNDIYISAYATEKMSDYDTENLEDQYLLSNERAFEVANYFISLGIIPERISISGFGPHLSNKLSDKDPNRAIVTINSTFDGLAATLREKQRIKHLTYGK